MSASLGTRMADGRWASLRVLYRGCPCKHLCRNRRCKLRTGDELSHVGMALAAKRAHGEIGGAGHLEEIDFILRAIAPSSSILFTLVFPGGGYESYHFISALKVLPDRVSRPFVDGLQKFWLRWPVTVDKAHFTPEATMVSKAAIARDWRVSRPYVGRCVHRRGCPTRLAGGCSGVAGCYESNRRPIARQIKEQGDSNSSKDTTLIPLAAARDIAWRGYDAILDLVLELPKNVAAECNPSNPQLALATLQAECTYILCKAGDVYAPWSKGLSFLSFERNPE